MANDEIKIKIETDVDKAPVQDLEDMLNQLSDTTVTVNTDVESDTESFDDISNSADAATDSVENLAGSLDGLSMVAVGDVLQQYGSQAEQMAQSMNEASITVGQLATQTGIAEPQLRNMIASISNATFPTNEAMMYVKSLDQMGVSSNNLGTSATGLDKINDAFGLGADKVNSLGQELGVLGVDMNNVGSSFNALAYANANTVGGMDNYFSFLRRYDSQFKELGLNVDQASVLIAGATQKFGGGRAALSGLSSILKESNGDLAVMEQQLGLTAGSLSNATQLTGQYSGQLEQMAGQEAEHKTLLDEIGSAWDRFSMAMGGALAPIGGLVGAVGQFVGVGTQLNGTLELMGKFGLLAGKLNIATMATNALAVAEGILNAVMAMNPIMLVVIALAALTAGLIWAYQNVDWFREAVNNAWHSITEFANNLINGARNAVNGFTSWISQLPGRLAEELNKMLAMASQFAMDIANALTGGAAGMVVGWITGSGEHSPGYMYEAFTGELKAMEDAPKKFDFGGGMSDVGSSMVESFNPNMGSSSAGVIGTNNIIINIGSVDNEEKIQEIVDAVEDALAFDNLTAGRTV